MIVVKTENPFPETYLAFDGRLCAGRSWLKKTGPGRSMTGKGEDHASAATDVGISVEKQKPGVVTMPVIIILIYLPNVFYATPRPERLGPGFLRNSQIACT